MNVEPTNKTHVAAFLHIFFQLLLRQNWTKSTFDGCYGDLDDTKWSSGFSIASGYILRVGIQCGNVNHSYETRRFKTV